MRDTNRVDYRHMVSKVVKFLGLKRAHPLVEDADSLYAIILSVGHAIWMTVVLSIIGT